MPRHSVLLPPAAWAGLTSLLVVLLLGFTLGGEPTSSTPQASPAAGESAPTGLPAGSLAPLASTAPDPKTPFAPSVTASGPAAGAHRVILQLKTDGNAVARSGIDGVTLVGEETPTRESPTYKWTYDLKDGETFYFCIALDRKFSVKENQGIRYDEDSPGGIWCTDVSSAQPMVQLTKKDWELLHQ